MNRIWTGFSILSVTVFFTMLCIASVEAQQAQGGPDGPKMHCEDRFKSMDANGDGKVDKEEFSGGPHKGVGAKPLEDSFKAVDANGDGALSKDEFCAGKGPRGGMGKPS
jgi:Ca2+-binding EF-hand superfamily protein